MVVSLINRMDSSVLDVLGNCLGAERSVTVIEATPSPGRSQDLIRARLRNRTGCQERRRYHEGMYGVRPQTTRTAATAREEDRTTAWGGWQHDGRASCRDFGRIVRPTRGTHCRPLDLRLASLCYRRGRSCGQQPSRVDGPNSVRAKILQVVLDKRFSFRDRLTYSPPSLVFARHREDACPR